MSTEKDRSTIAEVLAGLRRRQRAVNSVRWGMNGLLIGGGVGCCAAVLAWAIAHPGTGKLLLVAAAWAVGVAVVGAVAGAVLPVSDLKLARAMDRAAASEDRFASAMQLAEHRRQERAHLVIEDAVSRVSGTRAGVALPVCVPRSARWLPVPVLVLAALLAILPGANQKAVAATEPEIGADEWRSIQDRFEKDLARIPKAENPEEQDLQKQLEQLSAMLKQNPDKKDALKEIAKLSDRIAQQRKGPRGASMKSAARSVSSSQALKEFAAKLKQGSYAKAGGELRKLADQLKKGELSPDAKEFESMASDLRRLAQMSGQQGMKNAGEKGAKAAEMMSREALEEALRRLAEQLEEHAGEMADGDRMGDYEEMLERLKRMMNRGKGDGDGEGEGEGEGEGDGPGRRAGKGGLKAGWGTASKWDGGSLSKERDRRMPDMVAPQERAGMSSTFQIMSPDERAKSGKKYEELYAEFVQKSEADLDLDSVPVACRDYLRRYFNAIKPQETTPADTGEERTTPPLPR